MKGCLGHLVAGCLMGLAYYVVSAALLEWSFEGEAARTTGFSKPPAAR